MDAKCCHDNGLPYCSLDKDCIIPMMVASPICGFLLSNCMLNRYSIDGDYCLEAYRRFNEEMGEFLDYLYTGGRNVRLKRGPLFRRKEAGDA